MRLTVSALAIALLTPLVAKAQVPDPGATPAAAPTTAEPVPAPPAETAPAPAPASAEAAASGLNLEALVDSYYMWNFGSDPTVEPTALRQFDTNPNSFTLNYAEVAAQYNADPIGFRLDFGYGVTGTAVNAAAVGASPELPPFSGDFIVQQ